jgi:hypothetical protein
MFDRCVCIPDGKQRRVEQDRTVLRSREDRKGCADQSSSKRNHPVLHLAVQCTRSHSIKLASDRDTAALKLDHDTAKFIGSRAVITLLAGPIRFRKRLKTLRIRRSVLMLTRSST